MKILKKLDMVFISISVNIVFLTMLLIPGIIQENGALNLGFPFKFMEVYLGEMSELSDWFANNYSISIGHFILNVCFYYFIISVITRGLNKLNSK